MSNDCAKEQPPSSGDVVADLRRGHVNTSQILEEVVRLRAIHGPAVMLAMCVDQYTAARTAEPNDPMERLRRFEDMVDARKRFSIAERKAGGRPR